MNATAHAATLAGALGAAAVLAACTVTRPMPQAPSPDEACRALTERLRAAVPPGQSLAELQARGIRLRTPLRFPPGTLPAADRASGAAVQGLIATDGSVVPGSPKAIRTIGEPQVADAMEAGALSMNFEFDHSARPTQPIPFTTTFAVCTRS